MKIVSKSVEVGGRNLTLEVGRFAEQATSAVLARYGDTIVLATVVASANESTLDYFPLSVEYFERLYAGGRIKGSRWVKREGRPTDEAVLKGRLIDRSIRPLFDKQYHHDIQVIVTILSVDGENDPDMLGMIAVSAALSISSIPWNGPIAAIRVGYDALGKEPLFISNPGSKEMALSAFDLVVSGTKEKIVMLEAGANQIPEAVISKGIEFAHEEIKKIIACISDLTNEVGTKKIVPDKEDAIKDLAKILHKDYKKNIEKLVAARVKKEREGDEIKTLSEEISEKYKDTYEKKAIEKALDYLFKQQIRENVLKHNTRADGRGPKDVRPIFSEVGLLPRTHGSAHFKRGQTQVLTIATLGSPAMEQLLESPIGESSKRYMHHYNMPPFTVGETGRAGFTSRREIGHGALAERALFPVIPSQDIFPYTIRLVSEVMSSNGSTSMASTCGSTLALMDAGVPISEPISGIAIGLMTSPDSDKYVVLSDIIGLEDFCGDMDFKIAGSKNGITAIQLDVKIDGLTLKQIDEILQQGNEGRMHILQKMLEVMPTTRPTLSQYAPRVAIIKVPVEKIGEVIGPGGKIIRNIITETGCEVDVDDDGTVHITGVDPIKVEIAQKWISGIVKDVLPGEVYQGLVKRILTFGAFIEILPGKEGMVHVSQMSTEFVSDPTQLVKIGQQVTVRVLEIDAQGRINLSMLFGEDALKKPPQPRQERPERRFDRGSPRRRY